MKGINRKRKCEINIKRGRKMKSTRKKSRYRERKNRERWNERET
jgi:hypothetical protein